MERSPYGGYASGRTLKAKKASSKRSSSTPYERPPVGKHASKLARPSRSWADLASRMVTKGATFLFTSLFKRQAPAIAATEHNAPSLEGDAPPPLEMAVDQPSNNVVPQPSNHVVPTQLTLNHVVPQPWNDVAGGTTNDNPNSELTTDVATLENLLKDKDMTADECNRYIGLLKAKLGEEEDTNTTPNGTIRSSMEVSTQVRDIAPWEVAQYQKETPQRAPWERNERPTMPRNGSRWTPIQMPITGGRELLKQRAPTPDDRFPTRSTIRAHQGELDLSCFRKEKKVVHFSPRLATSIPKQSSQTAHRIMESINKRKSPFKESLNKKNSSVQQSLDVLLG